MPLKRYSQFTVIEPQRVQFIVPVFTLAVPIWSGASGILEQFQLQNTDYKLSLKLPIPSFGTAFMLAVQWIEDEITRRFKLWDDEDGLLYYPIYNGERIGYDAVLEIWSVNSAAAPALAATEIIYSSVFAQPDERSSTQPNEQILLILELPSSLPPGADCNPFCDPLCTV